MKPSLLLSTITAGMALASSALAATITILPTKDITLDSGDPNQNGREHLLVGNNSTAGPYTSLVGYSLSGLVSLAPGQSIQVNSVTLLMNVTDDSIGAGTAALVLTAQRYNFSFDPTTATYAAPATGDTTPGGTLGTLYGQVNIPNTTLGTSQALPSITGNSAFISDLASGLTSGGDFNLLLSSTAPSATDQGFVRLGRVSDTGDIPVRLLVDYTIIPEPATSALAAAGILGLALRRRRC